MDPNRTAEETAQEIRRAADAFEGTTGMTNNSIEEWALSMGLILSFIGPLQVVAGLSHFSQIIKNLGGTGPIPQSIQELKKPNNILRNIADAHHVQTAIQFVHSLTNSSVRFDTETGKLTTYFFYTQNNFLAHQLIGGDEDNPDYFAYDSIRYLLGAAFCWNEYLDFLENRNENLVRLRSRRTIVYFFDPPPINMVLEKVEFLEVYKDISFINYFRSKTMVKLKSIKVEEGCSVRLENFTVCKIDGACEGEVDLYKCDVGWDPNKRVIDRVTCNKCQKMRTSWKRKLNIVGIVTLLVVDVLLWLWKFGVIFKSKEQRF
eukprot:scaffold10533_cov82-Cylindrotheca_fusiformis.AAC.1